MNNNSLEDRISYIRKINNLSQDAFGSKLSVTKSTISLIERKLRTPSERIIRDICREFNINENWLLNGIEPMMIEADSFSLDEFITKQGGTELEKEIIRTYFELPEDIRKAILEHFKQKFGLQEKSKGKPMTVAEMQTLYDSIPDTPMELEKLERSGKDDKNNAV